MERMGRMKIKDLCAQMDWQYQKFRRRIKANDFSPEDLACLAHRPALQGASIRGCSFFLPPAFLRPFGSKRQSRAIAVPRLSGASKGAPFLNIS